MHCASRHIVCLLLILERYYLNNMHKQYCVLFFFVAAHCLFVASQPFTLKVEPKTVECFHEELNSGTNVELSWAVLDGGLLDIRVVVKKDGNIIFDKLYFEGKDVGQYNFVVQQPGTYSFCFDNEMARFTVKTVTFNLRTVDASKKPATPADLTPMEKSIQKISEDLAAIVEEQEYYRWREQIHRNTAESTNARVQWWSIFESVLLILMSVGQVYYLRRLFPTPSTRRTA